MTTMSIVSGMVAGTPGQGEATWAVLQYLLGLARLGHDAYLVEPVQVCDPARSSSADYCARVMEAVGLDGHWCLVGTDGATAGLPGTSLGRSPGAPSCCSTSRGC